MKLLIKYIRAYSLMVLILLLKQITLLLVIGMNVLEQLVVILQSKIDI